MQDHVIEHIKLNVVLPDNSDTHKYSVQIEDAVLSVFDRDFNLWFDEMELKHGTIYIDNLSVNIHDVPLLFDVNQLSKLIRTKVRKQLLEHIKNQEKTTHYPLANADYRPIDAFLFYLENGTLPWWFQPCNEVLFTVEWFKIQLKEDEKNTISRLRNVLTKSDCLWRLIYHIEKNASDYLLGILVPELKHQLNIDFVQAQTFIKLLEHTAGTLFNKTGLSSVKPLFEIEFVKNLIRFIIIIRYLHSKELCELGKLNFKEILPSILPSFYSNNDKQIMRTEKNQQIFTSKASENIGLLENAGIVILCPYLQSLFTQLQIIDPSDPAKIKNLNKAVSVLAYCATGLNPCPEFKLGMVKVFLGLKPEDLVPEIPILDKKDVIECHTMLKAVVGNWKSLKNTSVGGLQEAFLSRSGKLTEKEQLMEIQMELNTIDVLLDALPWNISYIKLPWLKYIIVTHWR